MQSLRTSLVLALALGATAAQAAEPTARQRAFQDHVAYVATFAMPVVIEKCEALQPGYLHKAAPLYFRFVNERQDQIERGRLLTVAEFKPDETLHGYRKDVLASRLGRLDTGTREEKLQMCEGALARFRSSLEGALIPGEWPSGT